jgi:anti-sigma factor RsiW
MDHEVATTTHAVERYLLGEMPTSEREEFEEHYFSCADCAEDVRTASALVRDLRTELRERRTAPKTSSTGWLSWLRPPVLVPTFAALTLLVVVGYQNAVVMPDLKAPRSMASAMILDGTTRGEVPILRQSEPLHFKTAVEGASAPRLYVELDTESGSRVRSGVVAAPPRNQALDLYFPGSLSAGPYDLVVRDGEGGKELARSRFGILDR